MILLGTEDKELIVGTAGNCTWRKRECYSVHRVMCAGYFLGGFASDRVDYLLSLRMYFGYIEPHSLPSFLWHWKASFVHMPPITKIELCTILKTSSLFRLSCFWYFLFYFQPFMQPILSIHLQGERYDSLFLASTCMLIIVT